MCGAPLETKAGTAGLEKPDLEKAKALLKELGYDGRPAVFMQPSDLAANFNATVVVAEAMRKARPLGLGKEPLERAVEAQDREPALSWTSAGVS